jgi:hypothetical protein
MLATGQAIDRLRYAWLSQAVASYSGCADVMSVALVISRHFSSEKGFAWLSYERVAAMLGWSQKSPAAGYERVRRALGRLAEDQYLVTTTVGAGVLTDARAAVTPRGSLTLPGRR